MRYPRHQCPECGLRLFAHVEGGVFCPDCGYYFERDDDGGTNGESEPANDSLSPAASQN